MAWHKAALATFPQRTDEEVEEINRAFRRGEQIVAAFQREEEAALAKGEPIWEAFTKAHAAAAKVRKMLNLQGEAQAEALAKVRAAAKVRRMDARGVWLSSDGKLEGLAPSLWFVCMFKHGSQTLRCLLRPFRDDTDERIVPWCTFDLHVVSQRTAYLYLTARDSSL